MADLKHIYNDRFFHKFLGSMVKVVPNFDMSRFMETIYDYEWEQRELKQRMRHISLTLNEYLPGNYSDKLEIILKSIPQLIHDGFKADNLEFMFYPDYVEVFGLEEPEISIPAFEEITQYVSCEFAVRPFLIQYPDKMILQMKKWAAHSHASVRRLASEGCRPRLPWAMALPFLKQDPEPILPILEALKSDPSEYVRRSVANNLNDISKDHPLTVISIAKTWQGKSKETDKLIKHACRTLLKQGDSEVMQLFGFGSTAHISIADFTVHTPQVQIGDYLEFSFKLKNNDTCNALIRLEYGVYYQKANGSLSRKVYKISEKEYAPQSETSITRKQSFKLITTRKFHKGLHQVSLIMNGKESEKLDFELVN